MRSRRLLLAATVATGLVLTGCSSSSQDDPVEIAQDYVTAVLEGNADTVCELTLTDGEPNTTDEEIDTCKEGIEQFLNPQDLPEEDQKEFETEREKALKSLEDDSFKETTDDEAADDEATVAFELDGEDESVTLKKVDEKWYVNS